MKQKIYALVNMTLYGVMLTMNALANILPINGKNTGELSDQYPNLFVPAGITFSIWGFIYILLLFFVVYQVYAAFSKREVTLLNSFAGSLFGLTCILNSLWILAWHYEYILLSVVVMLGFITALILLYRITDKTRPDSLFARFCVKVPISVYLGWISIATIANLTALLVSFNWSGFGIPESIWAVVMIGAGALLATLMLIKRGDIAYSLVVIWAFTGIIIKRSGQTIIYNEIIYAGYIAILIIVVAIVNYNIHSGLGAPKR